MRREGDLEIIVKEQGHEPAPMVFEEVFRHRDTIESITLLWDASSFYVSRSGMYFIVCGGRRIHPDRLDTFDKEKTRVFLVKRHQQDMSTGDGDGLTEGEHRVYYCLGLTDDSGNRIYVQATEDGRFWIWKDEQQGGSR